MSPPYAHAHQAPGQWLHTSPQYPLYVVPQNEFAIIQHLRAVPVLQKLVPERPPSAHIQPVVPLPDQQAIPASEQPLLQRPLPLQLLPAATHM